MTTRDDYLAMWIAYNREFVSLGAQIVGYLSLPLNKKNPHYLILTGFTAKAVRTLESVLLLAERGYWEEAKSLARVLLELCATVSYFEKLHKEDDIRTMQRVIDDISVGEYKLFELSQFRIPSFTPEELQVWHDKIDEIKGRYSDEDYRRIRKHGFSGKSTEEMFRELDLLKNYNLVYREWCRNIHSRDLGEQGSLMRAPSEHFFFNRNVFLLSYASSTILTILLVADVEQRFADRFRELGPKYEQLSEQGRHL